MSSVIAFRLSYPQRRFCRPILRFAYRRFGDSDLFLARTQAQQRQLRLRRIPLVGRCGDGTVSGRLFGGNRAGA